MEQRNVTGNPSDPSSAYTVFPQVDLQNSYDLHPESSPCTSNTDNNTALSDCTSSKGLCCLDFGSASPVRQRLVCARLYMHELTMLHLLLGVGTNSSARHVANPCWST